MPKNVAPIDPVADARAQLDAVTALHTELNGRLQRTWEKSNALSEERTRLSPEAILTGSDDARRRLDEIRVELASITGDRTELQIAIDVVRRQIDAAKRVLETTQHEAALDEGAELAAAYMVVAERIDARFAEQNDDVDLLHNLHVRLAALNPKLGPARIVPNMIWRAHLLRESVWAAGQAGGFALGLEREKALPQCEQFADRARRVLGGLLRRHSEVLKRAA